MGLLKDEQDDKLPSESEVPSASLLVAKLVGAAVSAGADLKLAALGGGLVMLEHFLVPRLQGRQREFFEDLAERIRRLEHRIDNLDQAREDRFVDAAITASVSAAKTSDRAKREALRNAVLNSLLANGPDEFQQQVFLMILDRYSGLHLAFLQMFENPSAWQAPDRRQLDKSTARKFVWSVFPHLRDEVARTIWADLYQDGLVNTPAIDNGAEGATVPSRATPYGRSFLAFIADPSDD